MKGMSEALFASVAIDEYVGKPDPVGRIADKETVLPRLVEEKKYRQLNSGHKSARSVAK